MFKIKRTTVINAPVSKVFEFMEDPTNLPEIWPSMIEVTNVQRNANGWSKYHWVYKMGGMKFQGESDTTSFTTNKHITTESTKGIQNRFDFDYADLDGKTEVRMAVEYIVPIPLISKMAEQIVGKLNEHEADILLENLKTRLEE